MGRISIESANDIVVSTEKLVKNFGNQRAVDELSLTVNRGDVYGFLGLNGAGKTTSLRLIMGLLRPDKGKVRLFGKEEPGELRRAMSRIGAMVESPSFYGHMSGAKNLELLGALGGSIPKGRVDEVLDIVGLAAASKKKARHYSLGMKQRLAIGLALMSSPELVVLDEPANGLDPNGIIEMRHLIKRLNEEEGTTFVVSSHLLYEIELMCNRIVILEKGRLLYEGPPEEFGRQGKPRFLAKGPIANPISSILKTHDQISGIVEVDEQSVFFECDHPCLPDIHKMWAEAGVDIFTVQEERMSLEEFFLEQSVAQKDGGKNS